jgi:hypothetical protein
LFITLNEYYNNSTETDFWNEKYYGAPQFHRNRKIDTELHSQTETMAPTLKAVDAVASTAAPTAAAAAAVEISTESTSSRMPNDNHPAATAAPQGSAAALPLPSPPLHMKQSTKTLTTTTIIARENPNDIPPDESAFLIEPHFSRHNPLHRNLSNLDLAMRCAICSELYHAPVTLIPCMHAFCSLCVRNHFKSTLTG